MQRIFAIAWLTWKAALRFKLFLVIAVLLILAVVGLPHDDGDFGQAEQLGGAPATFAGDEFQVAVALPHDQRLHNALLLDRVGQLAQRFRGEVLAGLQGAGANAIERGYLAGEATRLQCVCSSTVSAS